MSTRNPQQLRRLQVVEHLPLSTTVRNLCPGAGEEHFLRVQEAERDFQVELITSFYRPTVRQQLLERLVMHFEAAVREHHDQQGVMNTVDEANLRQMAELEQWKRDQQFSYAQQLDLNFRLQTRNGQLESEATGLRNNLANTHQRIQELEDQAARLRNQNDLHESLSRSLQESLVQRETEIRERDRVIHAKDERIRALEEELLAFENQKRDSLLALEIAEQNLQGLIPILNCRNEALGQLAEITTSTWAGLDPTPQHLLDVYTRLTTTYGIPMHPQIEEILQTTQNIFAQTTVPEYAQDPFETDDWEEAGAAELFAD